MVVEFCTRIGRRAWPLCFLVIAGCFGKDGGPDFTGGCPDAECSDTPVMVTGGKTFTKIAAGRFHTCGLLANGEVWCWGSNESSLLGVQTVNETCDGGTCSRTPVRAAGTETFKSVSAGTAHTCAVNLSGVAKCWGVNAAGELGNSSYGQVRFDANVVSGDHIFAKVASGERFSCALDDLGALSCWGIASDGQLGTSSVTTCTSGLSSFLCSPSPVAANSPARFSRVEAGSKFGCALSTQGELACWGTNVDGQLGTGTFTASPLPVAVQGTGTWQTFAVGESHACGIKAGAALCWGLNSTAQLGNGSKAYASNTPQPVAGTRTYTQITAGFHHTCAIATDGNTWCLGSDKVKQLGRG